MRVRTTAVYSAIIGCFFGLMPSLAYAPELKPATQYNLLAEARGIHTMADKPPTLLVQTVNISGTTKVITNAPIIPVSTGIIQPEPNNGTNKLILALLGGISVLGFACSFRFHKGKDG